LKTSNPVDTKNKAPSLFAASGANHNTTNAEIIKKEVNEDSDLDLEEEKIENPSLHSLVENEDCKGIVQLIEEGNININSQDEAGRTALYLAVENDCELDIIKILASHKDIKLAMQTKNGKTVLHLLSEDDGIDETVILLRACCNQNFIEEYELDDIETAQDIPNLSRLLEMRRGEETGRHFSSNALETKDYEGNTPLHLAARYGSVDVTKLLVAFGANCEVSNNNGKTPIDLAEDYYLVFARKYGNFSNAREQNISENIQNDYKKRIKNLAFLKIAQASDKEKTTDLLFSDDLENEIWVEIFTMLLEDPGFGINFFLKLNHESGRTALDLALKRKEMGLIESLIERGGAAALANHHDLVTIVESEKIGYHYHIDEKKLTLYIKNISIEDIRSLLLKIHDYDTIAIKNSESTSCSLYKKELTVNLKNISIKDIRRLLLKIHDCDTIAIKNSENTSYRLDKKELTINLKNIFPQDIVDLAGMIGTTKNLKKFEIFGQFTATDHLGKEFNKAWRGALIALLSSLQRHKKNLHTLTLSGCVIDGTFEFDAILENNNVLQNLSLSHNQIGKHGTVELPLLNHSSLKNLDLSYNLINENGMQHLSDDLKKNRSLISLGLKGNTAPIVETITQQLKYNKTIILWIRNFFVLSRGIIPPLAEIIIAYLGSLQNFRDRPLQQVEEKPEDDNSSLQNNSSLSFS
jgi:hypothetical protein